MDINFAEFGYNGQLQRQGTVPLEAIEAAILHDDEDVLDTYIDLHEFLFQTLTEEDVRKLRSGQLVVGNDGVDGEDCTFAFAIGVHPHAELLLAAKISYSKSRFGV